MKLRSAAVLIAVVAGLVGGTLAPAQAAATDPVTNLTVNVVQTPGHHDSWTASVAWTGNPDANTYSVLIADHEDGTVTSGKAYGNKDTSATSTQLVSDNLAAGQPYWIAVQPIAPANGTVVTAAFTAPTLDTTAPNGTFKLDRTTAYLSGGDPFEGTSGKATITITQTGIDAGTVTRTVLPGDGSATKAWTSSKPFPLQYTKAGTFAPKVRLVDDFGNVHDVALPTVRVSNDNTAPKVAITRPASPAKVASWRVIRGTSSDVGVGVGEVASFVVEKRGKIWWSYDFGKKKWLKGYTTVRKTIGKSKARPAEVTPTASGAWTLPALKGLTKGTLHVEVIAIDKNYNARLVKTEQKIS